MDIIEEKETTLKVDKILLIDGTTLVDLEYVGSIEMFYTQLMLGDFMMFEQDEDTIMVNSESIITFTCPASPDDCLATFIDKYLDALSFMTDDLDDDPTPPTKGKSKSHLRIIK